MKGEAIHHAGEIIGDGLEIHAAHPHLQGLAKHAFKGWHDRFEIHLFAKETECHEILGERPEIAVHQVHHRLNQAGA